MKQIEINGYEGAYSVLEDGRILNLKKNKFLKNVYTKRYCVVLLYKNGKRKMHYVHRLVADAFCKKIEGKNHVNHKDFDRKNNNYLNLEWVTPKENTNHYITSDKFKPRVFSESEKNAIKERLYKNVLCLETNKIYKSITEFAYHKNISVPQASMKLNGKLENNLNAKFINHFKKQFL